MATEVESCPDETTIKTMSKEEERQEGSSTSTDLQSLNISDEEFKLE